MKTIIAALSLSMTLSGGLAFAGTKHAPTAKTAPTTTAPKPAPAPTTGSKTVPAPKPAPAPAPAPAPKK